MPQDSRIQVGAVVVCRRPNNPRIRICQEPTEQLGWAWRGRADELGFVAQWACQTQRKGQLVPGVFCIFPGANLITPCTVEIESADAVGCFAGQQMAEATIGP